MISEISNFLAEMKRDSASMNHIAHYDQLERLFGYAEHMSSVCFLAKTIVDEYETFGKIGVENLQKLKRLFSEY